VGVVGTPGRREVGETVGGSNQCSHHEDDGVRRHRVRRGGRLTRGAACAVEPDDDEIADWELTEVDPSSVAGEWADDAMSAAFRVANRAAWSLACWIREAAHASAGTTARARQRRRPGKVPAASLGWSEGYGAARIEFARQLLERLPRLGSEMESGRLEEKARI
jgi:hypothetical protein